MLKIILFGLYATGRWVDEPHTKRGYQSDYDLLIIINQKELTDRADYWSKAVDRLDPEWSVTRRISAPVNFIVHTLQEVNDGLAHGRYFFIDVARDGVVLYQLDDSQLHTAKPKTPQAAYDVVLGYFEKWFKLAVSSRMIFQFCRQTHQDEDAAFNLQQACERLYHCVLLVYTFYTPYVHNIKYLRTQAEKLSPRLIEAWPRASRKQEAMFQKLKDACVKSRHSDHFKMTEEEFTWLSDRVEMLGEVVNELCPERLAELKAAI